MQELKEIAFRVITKLIDKNISLSSAESMTGGYFAKTVTDVPGASKIFDRSLVTYTKAAKVDELGIDMNDINSYGVVSSKTAELMAKGLFIKTGTDICISITGVAGPGPNEGVLEGTFYIGLSYKGDVKACKYSIGELGREKIRETACIKMFELIEKLI